MIEKVFGKIIDNPKITLNGILGLTIVLTLFIPKLTIDFSIEHLFSQNDPAVEEYFSFRNDFGREDNVITIIYEPIDHYDINLFKELENIFYDLEELNGVERVISIFTLGDLDTRAWLGDLDGDNSDWNRDTVIQKLEYIQSDPAIGSRILSKDLRFGAFILTLSDFANNHQDRSAVLKEIKRLTHETSPSWTYSGVSVLRTEYVGYMVRDNFLFLPPIALILISLLSYVFRNWVFVVLPMLTVLTTVIWLLGIMGLFGLEINIMTYIVPTLLFIIGISDAIHIQARFRENLNKDSYSPREAMLVTINQMSRVIFLTSATTSIGFIALMTTSISIVQEFGMEIALGVMIAWLVSITLVPSGIMLFKSFGRGRENTFSPILLWLSDTIPKRPWVFIIIPLFISFTAIYKIKDLSTDASLMDDLRPENKLFNDLKLTEQYFGGVLPFEVLLELENDQRTVDKTVIDHDILIHLDKLERLLNKELSNSRFFSIMTLLESVKRIRGDESSVSYDKNFIDQVLDLRGDQQIQLINKERNALRITGLIENKTSSEMGKIYAKIDSLSRSFPPYLSVKCTGTTVVALRTNNYLVQSLVNSLGVALVFISIIMAFMFRNKSILLASLITNLIPIFTVLGLLSWLGISIRPPTAMTFSVALGIAVDDSLHFLLRYRKELTQCTNRVEAIKATIMSTGSALMITTTILVSGFSVLLLSAFLPTYQFGMLSAGMIGTALLCDLTLLPALCLVLPHKES